MIAKHDVAAIDLFALARRIRARDDQVGLASPVLLASVLALAVGDGLVGPHDSWTAGDCCEQAEDHGGGMQLPCKVIRTELEAVKMKIISAWRHCISTTATHVHDIATGRMRHYLFRDGDDARIVALPLTLMHALLLSTADTKKNSPLGTENASAHMYAVYYLRQ